MQYNFDELIARNDTNSVNYEGWENYLVPVSPDAPLPYSKADLIRMWVADMDFATPAEIRAAIKDRLDKQILGYTLTFDPSYFEVLEQWFLKRYAWHIDRSQLVFAPGVVPALNRLVQLLTRDGGNILVNTPAYAPFKAAGDINNRKVFYSRLVLQEDTWHMDFEDIARQLDDDEQNIRVYIFCNPHNPTGRIWSEAELRRLGELCIERNVWLISDEIHCDLLRQGQKHQPMAALFPQSDHIITCTAPSKTFNLAGNLLSHIFIPNQELRHQWNAHFFDLLSPLSIEAAKAAYRDCEEWLEQLKSYLDGNFAYVANELNTYLPLCHFKVPDSTYLAWINIAPYLPSIPYKTVTEYFAREAGVILEGGNRFLDNGAGYIRLNLAAPRSVIQEGMRRIISLLLR